MTPDTFNRNTIEGWRSPKEKLGVTASPNSHVMEYGMAEIALHHRM